MNIRPEHPLACLATVLGVTACATARLYEGEVRLSEDVAIIRSASRLSVLFSPNPVYVQSVDGREIGAGVNELIVDPGVHELVTRCRSNLIYGSTHTIELEAEPGATYRLESVANPTTHCSVRVFEE